LTRVESVKGFLLRRLATLLKGIRPSSSTLSSIKIPCRIFQLSYRRKRVINLAIGYQGYKSFGPDLFRFVGYLIRALEGEAQSGTVPDNSCQDSSVVVLGL
jgi:hypothetical protein